MVRRPHLMTLIGRTLMPLFVIRWGRCFTEPAASGREMTMLPNCAWQPGSALVRGADSVFEHSGADIRATDVMRAARKSPAN
jgi:hypothetical protein